MRHALRSIALGFVAALATAGAVSLFTLEDTSLGVTTPLGRHLALPAGTCDPPPSFIANADEEKPPPVEAPRISRRVSRRPRSARLPPLPSARPLVGADVSPPAAHAGATAIVSPSPGAVAEP